MKRNILVLAAAVTVGLVSSAASAGTLVVNDFGAGGWYSWDTRNTSGTQLVGTTDTNPYGAAYFGVPASGASDTAISKQIVFMGEGQTVNDAAGNALPASPTGSLNGKGYVRLDGTSTNSGKSDISYVNTAGITAASNLNSNSFTASYSFYTAPDPTSREPGLNISVIGTDSNQYTFSYVAPTYLDNAWYTETVDNSTAQFALYISGGPGNVGSNTLAGWAASAYGPTIFGAGAEVWRVGFNIGSGQRQAVTYIDDLQSNILNGGDVIDFQAPAAVPLPKSAWGGLALIGGLGLVAGSKRLRRQPA